MTVRDLERLFDYSYWANRRLFEVLSDLTPEEFTRTVAGSYGSIRNTLVHVLNAEKLWLERCGGPSRGAYLEPDVFPTVESLVEAWGEVERQFRAFLSGLRDEDLSRHIEVILGGTRHASAPLGEMLLHAALHPIHHRGQVALLIRELGHAPGNFDKILYDLEQLNPA